jgi:hypothetical protein
MKMSHVSHIAGYLANPKRMTHIEVELPQDMLAKYKSDYEATTEGFAFPKSRKADPIYIIPKGGDKWGREMRIYYVANSDAIPSELLEISTKSNRHGYEFYNHRVNNNDLIDQLIVFGFVLGSDQDLARIKGKIPRHLRPEFDSGYHL